MGHMGHRFRNAIAYKDLRGFWRKNHMGHGWDVTTHMEIFALGNFWEVEMSILKKISEAKFHGDAQAVEISPPENFDGGNFPCGHSVAACGWICSATRRARCAICDPRAAGIGSAQRSTTLAAQGDGDDVSPTLAESRLISSGCKSEKINSGGQEGSAYAFFDARTASGTTWMVATRMPSSWGMSSGDGRKQPANVAAGMMLGWAGEREWPSLGHARFASIQEWQRSLGVELDEHGRFDPPAEILAWRKNSQHGDGRQ